MPKKAKPESPEEQRERFEREVQERIAAGELDPDAAGAALDDLMRSSEQQGDDR